MKSLVSAVVVSAALAIPAMSFAQSAQPMTRAQVRAQLVELERAGYNPAENDVNYPHDLQVAQQRVEQQKLAQGNTSGYGAPAVGSTAAGAAAHPAPVSTQPSSDIYGH